MGRTASSQGAQINWEGFPLSMFRGRRARLRVSGAPVRVLGLAIAALAVCVPAANAHSPHLSSPLRPAQGHPYRHGVVPFHGRSTGSAACSRLKTSTTAAPSAASASRRARRRSISSSGARSGALRGPTRPATHLLRRPEGSGPVRAGVHEGPRHRQRDLVGRHDPVLPGCQRRHPDLPGEQHPARRLSHRRRAGRRVGR